MSTARAVWWVCLITETCNCPSATYQDGGCKHQRRVEMELGQRDVPDLDEETDVEMMIDAHARRTREVATDGGLATEAPTQNTDEAQITGPWTEPVGQGGANYWGCSDCECESLRRGDLETSAFHASGCSLR